MAKGLCNAGTLRPVSYLFLCSTLRHSAKHNVAYYEYAVNVKEIQAVNLADALLRIKMS